MSNYSRKRNIEVYYVFNIFIREDCLGLGIKP